MDDLARVGSDHLVQLRQTHIDLSLFDPEYVVKNEVISFIQNELKIRDSVVLDYGCGNSPYGSLFSGNRIIRADVQQNALKNVDVILQGGRIPLESGSVDLAMATFVLEHVDNLKMALDEIHRVLKPGGTFFATVPFIYREHEAPHDYLRFSSYAVKNLLKDFQISRMRKIGNSCLVAYSLMNEAPVKTGERVRQSFVGRIFRRAFNLGILPLLNLTLFSRAPAADDQVFQHLIVSALRR